MGTLQSVTIQSHMTMLLRRIHHNAWLLLSRSVSGCHTKQFDRLHCTSTPSLKMLPHTLYTLQYSADIQGASALPPQHPFQKRLATLYPWIAIPEQHRKTYILKSLERDAGKYEDTIKTEPLKLAFEKLVQPFLVSRCVLLTKPLDDKWVQWLHLMNSKLIGRVPVYGTSLDLMRCLDTLHSIYWADLLNILVADRVMVVEDWERSLASIERMVYDHGMQLPSRIGDDESKACKAEYAALFHPKSRTATVASVIWKSQKMIDCQVNHGISCCSSGEAQGIALHNVLARGRQLGISKIDVVTDIALHDNVLKGTHDIDKTPYPHICMAIIQAAKHYKICRSRLERTEMLSFVNDMAKLNNVEGFEIEEMLEVQRRQFIRGTPVFRIEHKKSKLPSKPDAKKYDPKVAFPTNCYIEVPEKHMKLDALAGLLSVLQANFVLVITGSSESASKVQSVVEFSYVCSVIDHTCHVDVNKSTRKAMILVGQNAMPHIEAEKFLVIVFDVPKDPLHFSANHKGSNILHVNIITPDEKTSISDSEEVNPILYGFFRSFGGTILHKNGPLWSGHS